MFTEAVALGLIEPPRDADIVVGELQSFAISPSYGGPYVGIIATREKYMRQIPGRIVGETTDARGNRAFCLTLATREQHITARKGDIEHLHKPGAACVDGDRVHDPLRQGRAAGAGRAEPIEGALSGEQAAA